MPSVWEAMAVGFRRLVVGGDGWAVLPGGPRPVAFKPAVITVPRHSIHDCQFWRPEAQAQFLFTFMVVEVGAVLLSYQQAQGGHAQ